MIGISILKYNLPTKMLVIKKIDNFTNVFLTCYNLKKTKNPGEIQGFD